MPITQVESFLYNPNAKERTRAMRQAARPPWTPLSKPLSERDEVA